VGTGKSHTVLRHRTIFTVLYTAMETQLAIGLGGKKFLGKKFLGQIVPGNLGGNAALETQIHMRRKKENEKAINY